MSYKWIKALEYLIHVSTTVRPSTSYETLAH